MAETYEKIVVVTKRTALEELIERFGSRAQAEFYIEHAGLSCTEYQAAHDAYVAARDALLAALPRSVRTQAIERSFLPSFLFGEKDLVVTLGPDGLVVNVAKYVGERPIVAFNPDPARVDGILVPFALRDAGRVLREVQQGARRTAALSMARATLADGQTLLALNDIYMGSRTHVSARYRLRAGGKEEAQSSSGMIISTGVGSTGWLSSIIAGSVGIARTLGGLPPARPAGASRGNGSPAVPEGRRAWDDPELTWVVREPFASRTSGATLVCGRLPAGQSIGIESLMPDDGVIFSDGVEKDFLPFQSGAVATIALAERKARLMV